MTLIGLLIFALILGFILYLIDKLEFDGKIKNIVKAIIIVVAIIYLLDVLFGFGVFSTPIRLR